MLNFISKTLNSMSEVKKILSSIDFFASIADRIRYDVDMKNLTWFRTGGKVAAIFKPLNVSQLMDFLYHFNRTDLILPLGACSNIIIKDGLIDKLIVRLGSEFNSITINDESAQIGAAFLVSSISHYLLENEMTGLEFLSGIPGTIGGNLAMNAGCYGVQMSDVLNSFTCVAFDGSHQTHLAKNVAFDVRHNPIKNTIFIDANFAIKKSNKDSINENLMKIKTLREQSQPVKSRTSGSTFVNPVGHKAWELIDACGLRGYRIGGAEFSMKHCNFMINTGEATSADLINLGELARKMVMEKFSIDLKWEIKIIS